MMPRCEEIDDMLAAYALDAVDADERLTVLEHLVECRLHDEALAMYREVAGMLPLALEDRAPAPSARSSLLSAFEAAVSSDAPAPAPVTLPVPVAAPARSRTTAQPPTRMRAPVAFPAQRSGFGLFRLPALGYGLAAALLVVALGLGAWNLSLQGENRDLVLRASSTQDGMSLEVFYLEKDQLAVLKMDLQPAPTGHNYQAWKVVDGQPHSLGLVGPRGIMAIPTELAHGIAIAISVEPTGGSTAPTTTPVLVAEL